MMRRPLSLRKGAKTMRRKDREVKDSSRLEEIIQKCDCIHLGLLDGEYPYVVPMNFGYERTGDCFTFYMHAASEGKKLELIAANPKASFCMDAGHELVKGEVPCSWSFLYESVMGQGEITLVRDPAEKRRGLQAVMAHYSGGKEGVEFPDVMMNRVAILKLEVKNLTGKQHK